MKTMRFICTCIKNWSHFEPYKLDFLNPLTHKRNHADLNPDFNRVLCLSVLSETDSPLCGHCLHHVLIPSTSHWCARVDRCGHVFYQPLTLKEIIMFYENYLFDAVEIVLNWELHEENFANAVNDQAQLMAGVTPEDVIHSNIPVTTRHT